MRNRFGAALVFTLTAAVWSSPSAAQDLGPRTLLPLHVVCTDLPLSAPATPATLTIAGIQKIDSREHVTPSELAVIAAGTPQGLAVGQRYVARRPRTDYRAKQAFREGRGTMRPTGILTIYAVDERFALAKVDEVCDTISSGDYLEPLVMPTLPRANAPGGAANYEDRARVLVGKDQRDMFGDGDILSIDRGTAHGVTAGTRFLLYKDRLNGLPLVEVGEAVVLETAAENSRAVVVRALDFVEVGDVAVRRAPGK
jgi:hypothetical protein